MREDLLAVIEASYAEAKSPEAWLRNSLRAIAPHLDRGAGVFARFYRYGPEGFSQSDPVGVGVSRHAREDLASTERWLMQSGPPTDVEALARRVYPCVPQVRWLTEQLGHSYLETLGPYLSAASSTARARITARPEALAVIGGDPSGLGCIFFARDSRVTPLPRRTVAAWTCVAAHLVTGYRLARQRAGDTASDAVLDPGGKVLHLEPTVTAQQRHSLSEATRAIDRARGKLRRVDPQRALDLWKALVDGRWSLVDHFDHDGRRYVFARRNSLALRPWSSLTERESQVVAYRAEGQPIKLVAYQLGVSPATVSADIASAMRKVGARSPLALVAAYQAREARGEHRP